MFLPRPKCRREGGPDEAPQPRGLCGEKSSPFP
jgi:hypothetical protein